MERLEIKELFDSPETLAGKTVTVRGWVKTLRDSKEIGFIELNDGSDFRNVQIVFEAAKLDNYKEAAKLNVGSAVGVAGKFLLTPNAGQPFEINADKIFLEAASTPDYPLQKKRHSLEFLRTIAHLRPRTNVLGAVFRIRSAAAFAIHKFFIDDGFVYIHAPIVSCSDCEGAGETFKATTFDLDDVPKTADGKADFSRDFFQRPVYLTVSGQLQAEAMALAFGKVYTFGPAFRAEKSYTQRHAAEFWMVEPEIAFADLNDDMDLAENMIKYVVKYVLENCPREIEFLNKFVDKELASRLSAAVGSDFVRISYTDAVKELEKQNDKFENKISWGRDLQTEHERFLTERVFKKPVFVTDYPKDIKAFYMRTNDDGKTVAACDCLATGIGEIIGGSQREERLDALKNRIKELGLKEENYDWYLDLRRYGGVKHSGFGLGFERFVMYLTGISNIRDVVPFPRTAGYADF